MKCSEVNSINEEIAQRNSVINELSKNAEEKWSLKSFNVEMNKSQKEKSFQLINMCKMYFSCKKNLFENVLFNFCADFSFDIIKDYFLDKPFFRTLHLYKNEISIFRVFFN